MSEIMNKSMRLSPIPREIFRNKLSKYDANIKNSQNSKENYDSHC